MQGKGVEVVRRDQGPSRSWNWAAGEWGRRHRGSASDSYPIKVQIGRIWNERQGIEACRRAIIASSGKYGAEERLPSHRCVSRQLKRVSNAIHTSSYSARACGACNMSQCVKNTNNIHKFTALRRSLDRCGEGRARAAAAAWQDPKLVDQFDWRATS